MTTLECRLPPDQFTQFSARTNAVLQPELAVNDQLATPGSHLLIHEYDGPDCFTGRWIRTRVVDARRTTAGQTLTLAMIARNTPSTVRRRAA